MKLLKLTGKYAVGEYEFTMVDDEDYERLSKHSWWAKPSSKNKNRVYTSSNINKRSVEMQRFLMNFPDAEVDHIDRNPLNNQKSNLRLADDNGTSRNRSPIFGSSSKYLGVFAKQRKNYVVWESAISMNKKFKHLGVFKDEDDAAETYDLYALYYYGEFANLNFPNKKEEYIEKIKTYDFDKKIKYSSEYNGVSWVKRDKRWISQITINGIQKRFGSFTDEVEAAKCYDMYIIDNCLDKELNFPLGNYNA